MEGFQEKQQPMSQEPIGSSPKLLDVKKTTRPPFFLLVLVVLGFGLAAAAFALFSKPVTKKVSPDLSKPTLDVSVAVPAPTPPKEPEQNLSPYEKPLPSLTLSGILFGENGSFALINGKIIREGATINGAKLEKVSSDKAELSYEGRKIILRAR